MNNKLPLLLAISGSLLTSGCVIIEEPYQPPRAVYYPQPGPVYYQEPALIIVERGVRHDRYYYERHPEVYWRDRNRYPDRFRHLPPPPRHMPPPPHYMPPPQPPRHGPLPPPPQPAFHRGPVPAAMNGRPAPQRDDDRDHDKRKKKKDHHDDRDDRR